MNQLRDIQKPLDDHYPLLFPKKDAPKNTQRKASSGRLTDAELLDKMFASEHGADIRALWYGDASKYGSDESRRDLALMSHLIWWTNGDREWAERLFSQSTCGQRTKWQEREDYRQWTIDKALSGFSGGYDPEANRTSYKASAGASPAGESSAQPMGERKRGEEKPWPVLHPTALYGLAGDVVCTISPHTEAAPVAILFQLLAAFGNVIDRKAHFQIEADRHYGNLNVCLLGKSSKGRKGTSAGWVRRIFRGVDEAWDKDRVRSGLSSGEGLIQAVRDEDPETDRRLLVMEGEFVNVLQVMERDGNTLSSLVRNAWDHGNLSTMTKNPLCATGAHVSIIGHSTTDEVSARLSKTDTKNGFANRFLWVCVRREQILPDGGNLPESTMNVLIIKMRRAVEKAQSARRLNRDDEARSLWHRIYPSLSRDRYGTFGDVTGRAEAQVARLSLLYALLDHSNEIRAVHLRAALAAWKYAEDSARYIFGNGTGNSIADEVFRVIQDGEGMDRSALYAAFNNNVSAARLSTALNLLLDRGLIEYEEREPEGGRGRKSQVFYAVSTATKNEFDEFNELNGPDVDADSLNSSNSYPTTPSPKVDSPSNSDEFNDFDDPFRAEEPDSDDTEGDDADDPFGDGGEANP